MRLEAYLKASAKGIQRYHFLIPLAGHPKNKGSPIPSHNIKIEGFVTADATYYGSITGMG